MQKKLLATLLVSPLAFNALANIDIPFEEGWIPDGLVGDADDQFKEDGGMITAGVSAGSLDQTLSLPVGNYELSFKTTSNLKVSVDGVEITPNEDNIYKFTVATAGDVKITIEAQTKNEQFSFSDAQVELVFDFAAANAALTAKLNGVMAGLEPVDDDDNSDDAKALRELYEGYNKKADEIKALIATVKDGMTLADFGKLNLGKYEVNADGEADGTDNIDNDINALEDQITEDNYTAKLDAYNAYVANMAKYDVVAADLQALQTKMSTLAADKNAAIAGIPADKTAAEVAFINGHDNSADATEAMTAYANAVSSYLAEIKDAYENLEDESIDFEPGEPDVAATAKTEVNKYDTELRAALADVKAYNDWNEAVDGMKPYLTEQINTIISAPVVDGYGDLLADITTKTQQEVEDIYNGLKLPANYNLEYAAENLTSDKIDDAKAQMKQVADDFVANVKANNEVLEADLQLIEDAQAEIDKLPENSDADLVNSERDKLQGQLDSTLSDVKTAYSNLELTATTPDVSSVKDAITSSVANLEKIANIQDEFNEAKKYVDEQIDQISSEEPFDKFNDNFKNTFENIQSAINALTEENLDTTNIESAIENAKATADRILKDATNVDEQLEEFDSLTQAIDDAIVLDGEGATTSKEKFMASTVYQTVYNNYTEYLGDRNKAAGLQNQECYTILEDVYDKMNTVDGNGNNFAGQINRAINTFKTNVELSNTIVINKLQDKIETAISNAEAFNNSTSWDPAKTFYADSLAACTTELTNLKNESKKVANGTADKDVTIKTVYDDMNTLLSKVQTIQPAIRANQDAYEEQLNVSEDARNTVQEVIDYLNDKLNTAGVNPDADKVQEWQDALDELMVDITKANREIVKNYGEGNSKNYTGEFEENIAPISKKAADIKADIAENFGDLVAAVNCKWLSQWSDKYNNLRNLLKASIAKYNWYVTTTQVSNENFLEYIQSQIAESNEVLYQYNALITTLNSDVKANIDTQTTAGVVVTQTMYDTYTSNYQVYVDEINKTVCKMENNVLAGVNTYYADTLSELNNKLDGYETLMNAALNVGNETFVENQLAPYRTDLTDAQDAKALVSVPSPYTASTDNMTTAQYQAFLDYVAEIHEYVTAINGIANDYFQPVLDLKEETLVVNSWTYAYKDYAESGNTQSALSILNGYTVTTNGVSTHVVGKIADVEKFIADGVPENEDYEKFNAAVNSIKGLSLDGVETLEGLKDLMTRLLALEFDVDQYYNNLKDEWQSITGDKFNKQVIETALKNSEKSYEVLTSVAYGSDGIAGAGYPLFIQYYNAASTAVKEIREAFDANTNWSTAVKNQYQTKLTALTADLNQAYAALLTGESYYIGLDNQTQENSVIFNIKVAFNNLVESGYYQGEALETMNQTIDNLVAKFKKLNADYNPLTAVNAEAYKTSAKTYEAELTDLLNELQGYENVKDTYTDKALADLDAAYKTAEGGVNVALANLETNYPYVYESYTEKVKDLLTTLESYKAQWTASGNLVTAYVAYYESLMKDVTTDLNTILAQADIDNKVAKAQAELQAASTARYDALNSEINKVKDNCDALAETILSYNIGIYYSERVAQILRQLDTIRTNVNNEYASANGITEAEKKNFETELNRLDGQLTTVAENAADEYANTAKDAATNAYQVAHSYLTNSGIDIVNAGELLQKLYAENNKYWSAYAVWSNLTNGGAINNVDANVEFGNECTAIKVAINAILEEAKENTYVVGDLNNAPDGVVNVVDIQILIDWVGRGLTKEDLTPAQWAAADINGNGTLNISDVVSLINMVFHNDSDNSTVRKVMARSVVADNSTMTPVLLEENGDVRKYAVMLNNDVDFIGGQIDFNISAGAEIVGVTAAERAMSHDVNVFDNGSYTRVLLTSLDNEVIDGNDGALLIVEVKNGKLYVDNAVFADGNTVAHELTTSDPTLIDMIYESGKAMKEAIYNTAGQMMQKVQRGINIIRNSDGSVTKKMGK